MIDPADATHISQCEIQYRTAVRKTCYTLDEGSITSTHLKKFLLRALDHDVSMWEVQVTLTRSSRRSLHFYVTDVYSARISRDDSVRLWDGFVYGMLNDMQRNGLLESDLTIPLDNPLSALRGE